MDAFAGMFTYSVTLTMLQAPETPEAYERLVERWVRKVRPLGLRHFYIVVEWQPRARYRNRRGGEGGVPHAHGFVVLDEAVPEFRNPESYFGDGETHPCNASGIYGTLYSWLVVPWVLIAGTRMVGRGRTVRVQRDYGASLAGQHCARVDAVGGWFEYLATHAGLRDRDEQRARKNMPGAWQGRSCKVWRCDRGFPRAEPAAVWVDDFWRLRRRLRRYAVSRARSRLATATTERSLRKAIGSLVRARRMLRGERRTVSRVRGLTAWGAGRWIVEGLGEG